MIVSVASGKGGTGKTLIATSLALSLSDQTKVQLLDCDVEEPNTHIFLDIKAEQSSPALLLIPHIDEDKCTHCGVCAEVCAYNAIAALPKKVLVFPELCHGCGACSYLCPESAITEEGKEIGVIKQGSSGNISLVEGELTLGEVAAPTVIREVKRHIDTAGDVIIDASPGTSCPVIEAIKDSDFCLLVTEPTPFGFNDLSLAVETTRKLGIPTGVIINRAGDNDQLIEQYCQEQDIPILLRIPLDRNIAVLYSKGIPLVEGMPDWRRDFLQLFHRIKEMLPTAEVSR